MTLIADASSLVLLAKPNIITHLLKRNKVIIPVAVYEEVIKGKEKGRYDAFLIERLVREKKLTITKVNKKLKEKVRKLFGLYAGEGEVLTLALQNKFTVLTDDRKCLNAVKAANLKFITSLDVIFALFNKKVISKQKALESFNMLEEFGWYKKKVIEKYRRLIIK